MAKTLLVTGASGLLGRAVYLNLKHDGYWNVVGLAFSRAKDGLLKVDLTSEMEVEKVIAEVQPDVIIHSAAERRPDVVESNEQATYSLNIKATRSLCAHAAKISAPVVYISTDYVFDGTAPPYKETDKTNPLNKYGQSKLDGEKVVMDAASCNLVLRVPILYGPVESLEESAVTVLFNKVKGRAQCVMSHYERRYPTHVQDVAHVLKQLLHARLQDDSLTGIFHFSGNENMTKYDMAVTMATVLELSSSHIEADSKPSGGAPRPYNAHLDGGRLQTLGVCTSTAFKDGIKDCLQPYL